MHVPITFDPHKSARNAQLRGLPFELVEWFEWSDTLIVEDVRNAYPEPRFQALGRLDGALHMLVFTPRAGGIHVISLRRANLRERNRYAAQSKA